MLRFIGGGLSRDKWAFSIDNGGRKAQSRQYDGQPTAQERNRCGPIRISIDRVAQLADS